MLCSLQFKTRGFCLFCNVRDNENLNGLCRGCVQGRTLGGRILILWQSVRLLPSHLKQGEYFPLPANTDTFRLFLVFVICLPEVLGSSYYSLAIVSVAIQCCPTSGAICAQVQIFSRDYSIRFTLSVFFEIELYGILNC